MSESTVFAIFHSLQTARVYGACNCEQLPPRHIDEIEQHDNSHTSHVFREKNHNGA